VINSLIIFLLSFTIHAAVTVDLQFLETNIYQGEIIEAKVSVQSNSPTFDLNKLRGKTIGTMIHFFEVSKETALVKVVFTKVPSHNFFKENYEGEELIISWNEVTVNAVQVPEKLLFGEFEIPPRPKIILWACIALFVLGGSIGVFFINRRMQEKNGIKEKRRILITQLTQAKTYDDIVIIWKNKHIFLGAFPNIEESFKKFEAVLFKYQFRAQRTDEEKSIVIRFYKDFLLQVEGDLNGV